MTNRVYRTAQGKSIDMGALILKNEHNLNNFNDYVINELRPHDY